MDALKYDTGSAAVTELPAPDHDVIVQFGVIRGGQALVVLHARPELAGRLHLVAIGAEGRPVGRWAAGLSPSGDEAPETVPALSGLQRMKVRSRLRKGEHLITRFELQAHDATPQIFFGDNFNLDGLFYPSPEEFNRSQIARRKGNRPVDKESQLFLVEQMATAYNDLSVNGHREIALTMTASYAYRAVDLLSEESAQASVKLIDGLIRQLEAQRASDAGENALVSLLTAKWHAAAVASDAEAFRQSLLGVLTRADGIAQNSLAYTLCYNAVRSLCVLAASYLMVGDSAGAKSCFDAIGIILRGGGSRLTLYVAHLREFSSTCRVASPIGYFADEITRHELEGGEPLPLRRIPMLKGTVAEKAKELLISQSIRSSNPKELLPLIERMGLQIRG